MNKEPFLNRPSPGLFFDSEIHSGAWTFLCSALTSEEPYLLLTGAYGTGKTLLGLRLVEHLKEQGEQAYVYLSTPVQSYLELLRRVSEALELGPVVDTDDEEVLHRRIFRYFDENHERSLLILLDEAQEHNARTLNQVRLLVDYNHEGYYPVRLFLFATPEFGRLLKSPVLKPLDERIKRRYHLTGLNYSETKEYIYFRLLDSGAAGSPYFLDEAISAILNLTDGIPRRINNICDMCLSIGVSRGIDAIGTPLVEEATEYLGWSAATSSRQAPEAPFGQEQQATSATPVRTREEAAPPANGAAAGSQDPGHIIRVNAGHEAVPEDGPPTTTPESNAPDEGEKIALNSRTGPNENFYTWAWRITVVILLLTTLAVFLGRDLNLNALIQQLLQK